MGHPSHVDKEPLAHPCYRIVIVGSKDTIGIPCGAPALSFSGDFRHLGLSLVDGAIAVSTARSVFGCIQFTEYSLPSSLVYPATVGDWQLPLRQVLPTRLGAAGYPGVPFGLLCPSPLVRGKSRSGSSHACFDAVRFKPPPLLHPRPSVPDHCHTGAWSSANIKHINGLPGQHPGVSLNDL